MKKNILFRLGLVVMLIAGCASARQAQTYPMSYDQTYQTALEALDRVGQWKVVETDQLGGLITLEKGGYFMPRRTAKVIVKRVEPFRTRVELYEDKSPREHSRFFDAIDEKFESRKLIYPS